MPDPPSAVRWIARTLEDAGYPTWVVGGAVRDARLGVEHEDWDLATRARPGDVRRLFGRTVPIGIEHGTVGVLARDGVMYEVTTFRRDVETFGRRAVVEFADQVEDDLARRDFTMNAVAWHPLEDRLLDPFDGLTDLAEARLRTVGMAEERFAEDFLRVLRALRFAGRYALEIDPQTWDALGRATPFLPSLSAERIREELLKVVSLDPAPAVALELYAASGALATVFPELAEFRAEAPEAWERTLAWVEAVPRHRPLLRVAALLSGLDRAAVAAILVRLRFSNADTRRVAELADALRQTPETHEPEALRRWLAGVGPGLLPDWMRLQIAACRAGAGAAWGGSDLLSLWQGLRHEVESGVPLSVEGLAMDGRGLIGLGLRPGPLFGQILDGLLDRVLADPSLNTAEVLRPMARALAEELQSDSGAGR